MNKINAMIDRTRVHFNDCKFKVGEEFSVYDVAERTNRTYIAAYFSCNKWVENKWAIDLPAPKDDKPHKVGRKRLRFKALVSNVPTPQIR